MATSKTPIRAVAESSRCPNCGRVIGHHYNPRRGTLFCPAIGCERVFSPDEVAP